MFFIPSKNIPSLFNANEVQRDFSAICERVSSQLHISFEKLMQAFTQAAEDELNHRFQLAISTSTCVAESSVTPGCPTTLCPSPTPGSPTTLCSTPGCTVKRILKPHTHEGKVYCSRHHKKVSKKKIEIKVPEMESTEPTENTDTKPKKEFDFGPPRHVAQQEHTLYWSFCKITHTDEKGVDHTHRLHKKTGLVVDLLRGENQTVQVKLIGMFYANTEEFVDKEELPPNTLEWCTQSGIIV